MLTIDTNVFIYAVDARDPIKKAIALDLLTRIPSSGTVVSNQVFGEMFTALTKRLRMDPNSAGDAVQQLMETFRSANASRTAFETALVEARAGRLSFWDAVILASTAEAGCTICFSEDMQDGYRFGPIEVINPFGRVGLSARAATLLSPGRS